MKKISTLMGAVLLVASSFAQYHSDDRKDNDKERDIAYNEGRFKDHSNGRNDRYNNSKRERDMQVAKINREYDRRIETVKHKWFMSRSKKERIICSLQDKRRYQIKKVYEKFNRRHNGFDERNQGRHW